MAAPPPISELPVPGMPLVEYPEPGVQRWTFASDDPAVRQREYWRWLGWFGLDEGNEPFSIDGQVWLVRRRPT